MKILFVINCENRTVIGPGFSSSRGFYDFVFTTQKMTLVMVSFFIDLKNPG
jgi:hypothetical protein